MASTVTSIDGLAQLERRLAAIAGAGDGAFWTAIGAEFVDAAQGLVPVSDEGSHGDPPGTLRDSIRVAAASRAGVTIVAGGREYPAAKAVEYGTGYHRIRTRRARMLKFFWDPQGPPYSSRGPDVYSFLSTNKEPQRAQPFFFPVLSTLNIAAKLKADVVARWNGAA